MSTEKLRVGVIGVGALGRHHARILAGMPDVELVGVADANAQQAESVAVACGCEWTPDYRTLIGRIDAASIVVPTFLHRTVAEDLLCRSIPVMVEKPLAGSVEDGSVLVRLSQEHKIPLQVGHIERFNPAFEAVEARTAAPKYLKCERISPYAFRSMDIGVVLDLMIHDLELVLHLVGEMPLRVEAFGVSIVGGHEDCVQARLTFPSGCVADLTANRVSPTVSRSIQCWSESGCHLADLQTRQVSSFTPGEQTLRGDLPFDLVRNNRCSPAELKPEIFTRFIQHEKFATSDEDCLTAELQSFVDCVRLGRDPLVSGREGLAALQVAERVLKSVRNHAWDGTAEGRRGPNALLAHHLPAIADDAERRAA